MRFRNPQVPDDINVSRHNPFLDLILMAGGMIVGFVILAAFLIWLGGTMARHLPVTWEHRLADLFVGEFSTPDHPEITAELQALADRLAAHMELEPDARVVVHYLDSDEVNAFATLGGHVFILRGLIERMPNENALAMVMAHEIGHVANRDPAAQVGGVLLLRAVMALLFAGGADNVSEILTSPEALLARGFSREAEETADEHALAAVAAHYGHVAGAASLFELLAESRGGGPESDLVEFFQTHPLERNRIAAIAERADAEGWARDGPLTPLSPALQALRDEAL